MDFQEHQKSALVNQLRGDRGYIFDGEKYTLPWWTPRLYFLREKKFNKFSKFEENLIRLMKRI